MNLSIKENPGHTTVATMRRMFELAMSSTPAFKKRCNLEPIIKGGEFTGYRHRTTDALWIGFALGIRQSDRMAHQQLGFTLDWTSIRGL